MTRTALVTLVLALTALVAGPLLLIAGDSRPDSRTGTRPAEKESKETTAVTDFGVFRIDPPREWKPAAIPHAGVRKARYTLPAPSKELQDGELIVYYFGNKGAGPVAANLERWRGQFSPPPGVKAEDNGKITKKTVDGLALTILEVHGDYSGMSPQPEPEPAKKDYMMLAAIVDHADGAYYIRTLGPRKTIEHWKTKWHHMVLSIQAIPKKDS